MRRWLIAAAIAAGVAAAPSSASASCGEVLVSGMDVVFTGTAEETRNEFTLFSVDEVWNGPDLAAEVWIQTGASQPAWPFFYFSGVASSVDAHPELGEAYVVGATADFATSSCTMYLASDLSERPAEVAAPSDSGATGADVPWPGAVYNTMAGVVVVGVVIGIWLALRDPLNPAAPRPPATHAPARRGRWRRSSTPPTES